jgi:hypothetical protein
MAYEDIVGQDEMTRVWEEYGTSIPAGVIESVLLDRFSFTAEQLHEILSNYYSAETNTYFYEGGRGGGPREVAVVDIREEADGLVRLDYEFYIGESGLDNPSTSYQYKIPGVLTLTPKEDGSYRYRSVDTGEEIEAPLIGEEVATEPQTEAVTEPETEPATESPADIWLFDSTDHPIHGEMGMTFEERDYTLAVAAREIDVLAALQDDPRYPDICGGFAYRGGTMYIYSLDDDAVNALVRGSMAMEGIPYQLVKTTVSLRRLDELYKLLDADHEKYSAERVAFEPRYNQVAVIPSDRDHIDPDLQKLAEETGCLEIELADHIPPPHKPQRGIPKDLNEYYGMVYTTEGSPFNAVLFSLLDAEPRVAAGAEKDADFNGGVIYVYNLEQVKAIIAANEEAKTAYDLLGGKLQLVQVPYGSDDLLRAQVIVMNTLDTPAAAPFYSIRNVEEASIEVHGKGLSNSDVQKAARDAAITELAKYAPNSGEALRIVFVDEDVTRASIGDDIYDSTYIGGPSADDYYEGAWRRPPQ